jgi:serine protease Do
MKNNFMKFILIFVFGVLAGLFIYYNFGIEQSSLRPVEDTLFVNDLHASPSKEEVNDEISNKRNNSLTEAINILSPSVVGINVTQVREIVRRSPFRQYNDPYFRRLFPELFKDHRFEQRSYSLGSGFLISPDGYILTNEHVVEHATEIEITMTNGTKAQADIVGTDQTSDVALLKIDEENLPYAKLGDSEDIILGEWAIAIGNPFGLFQINSRATVTVGVISALNRDFGEIEGRIYQDMIQTDASINQGNSGGPLCNVLGEVIGMNAFIYTDEAKGSVGIGFAIPINRIHALIEDLKTYHRIDRNFWIGIRVKELDESIAAKLGYRGTSGVIITDIDRNSPAEKAGLELGDIILKIGKQQIQVTNDVTEAIFEEDYRVGDKMTVEIWRDGKIYKTELNLVKLGQ